MAGYLARLSYNQINLLCWLVLRHLSRIIAGNYFGWCELMVQELGHFSWLCLQKNSALTGPVFCVKLWKWNCLDYQNCLSKLTIENSPTSLWKRLSMDFSWSVSADFVTLQLAEPWNWALVSCGPFRGFKRYFKADQRRTLNSNCAGSGPVQNAGKQVFCSSKLNHDFACELLTTNCFCTEATKICILFYHWHCIDQINDNLLHFLMGFLFSVWIGHCI